MTPEQKRERYGDGPWVDEPDRVEFRAFGLPCLIRRHPECGFWCGYVALMPGHPLHGVNYRKLPPMVVHGGEVTYSDACDGDICHVPEPGEPDDVWWLGFHCGFGWDYVPYMYPYLVRAAGHSRLVEAEYSNYRDMAYARLQCEMLALQLAAAAAGGP